MKTLTVLLFVFHSLSFFSQNKGAKDSVNHAIFILNNGGYFLEADRILLKFKDSIKSDTSKIKFYIALAGVKGSLGKQNDAILYANKAMELSLKNDDFYMPYIISTLGFIHEVLEDPKKVIFYKKQILGTSNYSHVELSNYNAIIESYLLINNKDSALHYSNMALNKYSGVKFKDDFSEQLFYRIKLLKERSGEDNLERIIFLLKKGIKQGVLDNNGFNKGNIGRSYEILSEFDSAIHYYKESIDLCLLARDTFFVIRLYQTIINLYEKTGDIAKMDEAILSVYQLSHFLEKTDQEQYRELILKYENSKKRESTYLQYYIYLILIIVFLGAFVRFKRISKKRKLRDSNKVEISVSVSKKIKDSLKEIEKNKEFLTPNFTMTYLENKMGVNRKYIGLYFKTEKQISLIDYTNILRIKEAENRLKDPEDTFGKYAIEIMAMEVGYKTAATFKKHFSKYSDVLLITNKN